MSDVYEAVIQYHNGLRQHDEFIDPVRVIIIDNGAHNYRFDPELVEKITFRKIEATHD